MEKRELIKNIISDISITTFIVCIGITGCNSTVQKENVSDNPSDSIKISDSIINQRYLEDMETFKEQISKAIETNNNVIADLKAKMNNSKAKMQAGYEKKMEQAEQKNKELKKKIDEYAAEGKEKWEVFKTEFNKQMDSLSKDIKDLTSWKK